MIDENQLSSAHNILSSTKCKMQTTKTTPHNNRAKWLSLKASSYLSIGHYTHNNRPKQLLFRASSYFSIGHLLGSSSSYIEYSKVMIAFITLLE